MLMVTKYSVFLIFLTSILGFSNQGLAFSVQASEIARGLHKPWSLAVLPDQRFLVTEKAGRLRIIDQQGNVSPPISGLPDIAVIGQGGLLDVAVHPQFALNRWVYLSFVAGSAVRGYSTEVVRAELDGLALKNTRSMFVALPKTKGGRHFGGRLVLAPSDSILADGKRARLFISLGDRGVRSLSQNTKSHHGSIIRLNDDGSIPSDNPLVNDPESLPEIYSYGHRNVQGLAIHPVTGELWSHEHGPQGGDELNRVIWGANYGWPIITYGVNYGIGTPIGEGTHKEGLEQPEYYWVPSIAPSGFAFYSLNGQMLWLVGALKAQLLAILSLDTSGFGTYKGSRALWQEQRVLEQQFGRIRDVRVDGDRVFILTDASQGKLVELRITQ